MSVPPSSNHPTVAAGHQPDGQVDDGSVADETAVNETSAVEETVHAAIDIGTNSVHLLVARSTPTQRFEVLAQEKEVVRLGHGTGDMRVLEPDAIDRGIAALDRFRQVADIWDADIAAVATSAVREADNHNEFIDRARTEAGVEVEIISGVEEARLIHVGVLHALPVYDRRLVMIDIGGGSTEVLIGERDQVLDARSLKLGAIRLTDRFFTDEPLEPAQVVACRRYVRAFIGPAAHELSAHGFEVAAGSSGTIQTLAAMAVARRGDDPSQSLNNVVVTAAELAEVVEVLTAATTASERSQLPGMDSRRADIIVAGAIILEQLVAALGIEEFRISTFALREGVVLDRLRHSNGSSMHHLSDLRRASVLHLAASLDPDREHSEHLTDLALRLYDDLHDVHGLDDRYRELLEAAGLLHNVGLFINHSAHHKHSYYVIRNSEALLGFTHHEIELIAVIARYHRKSDPKTKHSEYAALNDEDRRAVCVLAGILRIAIGLDRSHTSAVADITTTLDPERHLLTIETSHLPEGASSLELYSANERRGLLADALGLDVEVTSRQATG